MEEADGRWWTLCQHHQIAERSQKEQLAFLRDMPESDIVRTAGDLKWFSFPLVVDGKTLTATPEGEFRFFLGPEADRVKQDSATEPIEVLIGDCDAEVRALLLSSLGPPTLG